MNKNMRIFNFHKEKLSETLLNIPDKTITATRFKEIVTMVTINL